MGADCSWLQNHIRDVPDFPEPGILYKDITPLLGDADALRLAVDCMADRFSGDEVDVVAGVEARGFIFASPVAYRFGAGFLPVRKAGKLPWKTKSAEYNLEYGNDQLEVHTDAVSAGTRVLIVDDVLATGGTAAATGALLSSLGAEIVGYLFLLELAALQGRDALGDSEVVSLITYE